MKIIYNKYIPLGKFFAINFFGIVFCRSDKGRMGKIDINHEYIHTLQQREMLYIFFFLWYCIEWLYRYVQYRDFMKAYYNINFEKEAYANERNLNYENERKPFNWWHQFVNKESSNSE